MTMPMPEIVSLFIGASALMAGSVKFVLDRYLAQIEKRFDQLESAIGEEAAEASLLREELLRLKAELPIHYVRREDDVRNQTVINAKLDALYMKIEGLREKGR